MSLTRKIGVAALIYALLVCTPLMLSQAVAAEPQPAAPHPPDTAVTAPDGATLGTPPVASQTLIRAALFGDDAQHSPAYTLDPVATHALLITGIGIIPATTIHDETIYLHVTQSDPIMTDDPVDADYDFIRSSMFVNGWLSRSATDLDTAIEIVGIVSDTTSKATGQHESSGLYAQPVDVTALTASGALAPAFLPPLVIPWIPSPALPDNPYDDIFESLCMGTLDNCLKLAIFAADIGAFSPVGWWAKIVIGVVIGLVVLIADTILDITRRSREREAEADEEEEKEKWQKIIEELEEQGRIFKCKTDNVIDYLQFSQICIDLYPANIANRQDLCLSCMTAVSESNERRCERGDSLGPYTDCLEME